MSRAKFDDARSGWEAILSGKHPFATATPEETVRVPTGRYRPNKYATADHEAYDRIHKKDLDKVGCFAEFAVKGADQFWPREKLVDVGKGKLAPRTFSGKAERREYLHRLKCERGWTFTEAT